MLRRDISFTFTGQLLRTFFVAMTVVIVARVLGPSGQGMFALAVLLPRTVGKFAQLGQAGVNATYPGRYSDQRGSIFLQTIIVGLLGSGIGVVVLATYYFWLPLETGQFATLPAGAICASMLLLPAENLQESLTELARGAERMVAAAVISVFGAGLQAIAMLVGLYVLNGGLVMAIMILVFTSLTTIPMLIWTVRDFATLDLRMLSRRLLSESLRFGGVLTVGTVAIFLIGNAGTYLLGQMSVSWVQIGLYSLAMMLARQLEMVPNAVAQAFLPRLSNRLSERERETPGVFRKTLLASMAIVVILAIAGPLGIQLFFGPQYAGSILLFVCLVPGIGLFASFRVLGVYLWARNKPYYGMINNWISLLVTVCLSVATIPSIGNYGAALGNVLGLLALSALTAWAYLRVSGDTWRNLIPRLEDVLSLARACRLTWTRQERLDAA